MSGPRIREAGDAAVLLELEPIVDPHVNARATAIAAAIRRAGMTGVRDVVSTFHSVAVYLDPLTADVDAVRDALRRASDGAASPVAGRRHDVPVIYGGDDGPDLEAVAAFAGLTAEAVVARHAGPVYRVFMLGFLPGFAYMAGVDDGIAMPRRAAPRLRVPAGSVGIAGIQTGIYPRDSPGGWQIIGRTPLAVFDPVRSPAALFAPGDTVRFVPASVAPAGAAFGRPGAGLDKSHVRLKAEPAAPLRTSAHRYVTVASPGLFTTIQDGGRWGHQSSGVPVAGPMDCDSHDAANLAVGNPRDAATLEATLTGPELHFEHAAIVAVSGADLNASIDGVRIPPVTACAVRPESVLRFGERRTGARAYVAFGGGIDVPSVLGSRATHVPSGLGGLNGRALVAGDRLPLGVEAGSSQMREHRDPVRTASAAGLPGRRLRVMPGPQDDRFTPLALDQLFGTRFQIMSQSNRMGYRLSGGRLPPLRGDMISDAAFTGGIQVPPSGEPILLMADRATTGGYPQIATVIAADLPLAGQLAPGDWVEFEACARGDAIAALKRQRSVFGGGR